MANRFKIGNKFIGPNEPVFIIAEIGQNHQGDINLAKQLIKHAKEFNADCVKFQKTDLNEKFNKTKLLEPYNNVNSWGPTYGEHKNYLEFTNDEFIELQTYAKRLDILFSASAMDLKSLEFLVDINVPFIKIGSGDANNLLLIEMAAKTKLPLIISTGMQAFETVQQIYNTVSNYHKNFVLMQCTSSYPTPYEEINLNVIKLYQKQFVDINIGYSGHEIGFHPSLAAVTLGAKVVERHLTIDKTLKGTDHKCSLNLIEFQLFVKYTRDLEMAFGFEIKQIQSSELSCIEKLGKTIVVTKDLRAGHKLTENDLNIKVALPKGIEPTNLNRIVGAILLNNKQFDDSLHWDDIQIENK